MSNVFRIVGVTTEDNTAVITSVHVFTGSQRKPLGEEFYELINGGRQVIIAPHTPNTVAVTTQGSGQMNLNRDSYAHTYEQASINREWQFISNEELGRKSTHSSGGTGAARRLARNARLAGTAIAIAAEGNGDRRLIGLLSNPNLTDPQKTVDALFAEADLIEEMTANKAVDVNVLIAAIAPETMTPKVFREHLVKRAIVAKQVAIESSEGAVDEYVDGIKTDLTDTQRQILKDALNGRPFDPAKLHKVHEEMRAEDVQRFFALKRALGTPSVPTPNEEDESAEEGSTGGSSAVGGTKTLAGALEKLVGRTYDAYAAMDSETAAFFLTLNDAAQDAFLAYYRDGEFYDGEWNPGEVAVGRFIHDTFGTDDAPAAANAYARHPEATAAFAVAANTVITLAAREANVVANADSVVTDAGSLSVVGQDSPGERSEYFDHEELFGWIERNGPFRFSTGELQKLTDGVKCYQHELGKVRGERVIKKAAGDLVTVEPVVDSELVMLAGDAILGYLDDRFDWALRGLEEHKQAALELHKLAESEVEKIQYELQVASLTLAIAGLHTMKFFVPDNTSDLALDVGLGLATGGLGKLATPFVSAVLRRVDEAFPILGRLEHSGTTLREGLIEKTRFQLDRFSVLVDNVANYNDSEKLALRVQRRNFLRAEYPHIDVDHVVAMTVDGGRRPSGGHILGVLDRSDVRISKFNKYDPDTGMMEVELQYLDNGVWKPKPQHSVFPVDWSEDEIIAAVDKAVRSPDRTWVNEAARQWKATVDGIEIGGYVDTSGRVTRAFLELAY